jgi:ABC-2 type transport system permease protein
MIGMFLTAMNVVKEKETGTIEQINVTPIKKWQFITGKLMPLWVIGMIELAIGLGLAKLIFHIPMAGSLLIVFGVAGVYLLVVLGLGLWVSTGTETQQQAMFIAWFIAVVFILMGGLFTPIESMPAWAQELTVINPIAHFIEIMRRVLVKGAGWDDIQRPLGILLLMAAFVLPLAIRQYRKVTA